ncbi:MAG TPA: 3-methylornithyl-N6-L-lysine dehydrogenase PylD [Desulfobacteraceae bacterium]|nr:3-methylornithyl-N6-L-lysine dehydrogenase PylD [Desulfobacteraceae bacterium]|tara:strand:+ start:30 stop:857 length:828 start_codon:yes stop_codon:yes gene_type:complete
MTRLTTGDISDISEGLIRYNERLQAATGKTLTGIAAHAFDADESLVVQRLKALRVHVIPVTAGQGIISDFSNTVAAILSFLGCRANVCEFTDASGLAAAYEAGVDAVMLADDNRFVGIHLGTRSVADNTALTGRVYAAALDLMAGGISGKKAVVLGCGPVGEAGARELGRRGAIPELFDIRRDAARRLAQRLAQDGIPANILPAFPQKTAAYEYILEATPSAGALPEEIITRHLRIAAPGVPLGMPDKAARMLGQRLVHDKLELGTAAMAVRLVL